MQQLAGTYEIFNTMNIVYKDGKKIYTSWADNREWDYAQLEKRKQEFVAAYKENGEVLPHSKQPIRSWFKRKKQYADVMAALAAAGVDFDRTILAMQRKAALERFVVFFQEHDRMPGKVNADEVPYYLWFYERKSDPQILEQLAEQGVDVTRTQDVVNQERNLAELIDWVEENKRRPKNKRDHSAPEDRLYRWIYHALRGKIKAFNADKRKDLAKELRAVLGRADELQAKTLTEEKRLRAEFRNAAPHGAEY
ncbi:MAG: hypothetical protein LBQ83_02105 [Candidatus Margulisbacteria bacterium]|jgi:hypothetical protein|nr:hypothetical protein [Candidatus Margulisiibacteriota bacterium]